MNKALFALFAIMFIIGVVLIIPQPVTVVSTEKTVICNDGICNISVLRLFSDGSGAGTESTIPQELYNGIKEETTCENGFWVTRSVEHRDGVVVAVASSITEKPCSK